MNGLGNQNLPGVIEGLPDIMAMSQRTTKRTAKDLQYIIRLIADTMYAYPIQAGIVDAHGKSAEESYTETMSYWLQHLNKDPGFERVSIESTVDYTLQKKSKLVLQDFEKTVKHLRNWENREIFAGKRATLQKMARNISVDVWKTEA